MLNISAMRKQSVAERWLALIVETYPDQARQFLVNERDPFRNPVGQALRENIFLLADELLGEMDADKVKQALRDVVRIRAVQDSSPKEAIAFVFLLKNILRDELTDEPEVHLEMEKRIDDMALIAFDFFVQCRQRIYAALVSETRRRVAVLEKIRAVDEGR